LILAASSDKVEIKNKKLEYALEAFFKAIDWQAVNKRFNI